MIILLSEEKGDSRSLLSHDRLYQREVFSIATIFCSILGPNFKHCCFKVIIILLSEEKGDSRSLLSHDRLYQTEVFSIATIFCSIFGPNFKHCCFKAPNYPFLD